MISSTLIRASALVQAGNFDEAHAAGVILGEQYKSLINKFDRMRRKYQSFVEDAGRIISRYEAGQAIKDAEEFIALVNGRIREKYSQMSLLNDVPQLVSR